MDALNLLHLGMSFLAHLLGPLLEGEAETEKERVLAEAMAKTLAETQAELRRALERLAEYEARIVALDKELTDVREDCERFRNALRVSLEFRAER